MKWVLIVSGIAQGAFALPNECMEAASQMAWSEYDRIGAKGISWSDGDWQVYSANKTITITCNCRKLP
jgi:hypothetical protein